METSASTTHTTAHLLHFPAVTTTPHHHPPPRTPTPPTRPPRPRPDSASSPASTAVLFACASPRAPPILSAAVDPRGRRQALITSSFAHLCTPAARPRAPACTSRCRKVLYSCRSTLPNANDWTRQDDSHRLLRPLTLSPRRAAIQRRPSTRALPPPLPTPR
jgi:hypothetical protein